MKIQNVIQSEITFKSKKTVYVYKYIYCQLI